MKHKKEVVSFVICFLLWFFYLAHFFTMNDPEPFILGIPNTVFTCALGVVAAWILNLWCGKDVWDPFDKEDKK